MPPACSLQTLLLFCVQFKNMIVQNSHIQSLDFEWSFSDHVFTLGLLKKKMEGGEKVAKL